MKSAEDVLADALALSVQERAELAGRLLESIEDTDREDSDRVESAWSAEIERRQEELRSGKVRAIPWEEAERQLFGIPDENPELKIEIHPEALEEVRSAYQWYRERSDIAARNFSKELRQAMRMIKEQPLSWLASPGNTRRFLLGRFPYVVVYQMVSDEMIQILAVAHVRRRPGYWRGRGKK